MKTYLFLTTLALGFFGIIAALTRPDLVTAKYHEITRPVIAKQEAIEEARWKTARSQEHARWMIEHQLPNDCLNTTKAVRQLECANIRDINENNFSRVWTKKINSGWKPD